MKLVYLFIFLATVHLAIAGDQLVSVQVVARHGNRAPSDSMEKLCPNWKNRPRYPVDPAMLTPNGEKQLLLLGEFMRSMYGNDYLLSSTWHDAEVNTRSTSSTRCIQSAQAMGRGMYPDGTGPHGFTSRNPTLMPVYSCPSKFDTLLETVKNECQDQASKDFNSWDEDEGKKIIKSYKDAVSELSDICGFDFHSLPLAGRHGRVASLKVVSDGMSFDNYSDYPISPPSVSRDLLRKLANLSWVLLDGQWWSKNKQVTYLAGDLPETLVDNFEAYTLSSHHSSNGHDPVKMQIYHAHRELLYTLDKYLGVGFDFPGLPKGAIPPGTSLFFELHYGDPPVQVQQVNKNLKRANGGKEYLQRPEEDGYWLETYYWAPNSDGSMYKVIPYAATHCKNTVDAARGVGVCTLHALRKVVEDRNKDTGTWQKLCA